MSLIPENQFHYDGMAVGVEAASSREILWLREFLTPSFTPAMRSPDVIVRHEVDRQRFDQLARLGPAGNLIDVFMMDRQVVRLPQWRVPGVDLAFMDKENEILYLLQHKHIVLLSRSFPRKLRTCLMRTVRELAMGHAQRRAGRFLHAASFAVGGKAAIITGPGKAGKTSLLTYVLRNSQADFLANDRLMIKFEGNQSVVIGMPTWISIRPHTFDLFPGLLASLKNQRFSPRSTLDECRAPDAPMPRTWSGGRRGLSPSQYCSLMGSKAVEKAAAAVLVFPVQTGEKGGTSLRKLQAERVETLLRDCLFENIHPHRVSQAFSGITGDLNSDEAVSDDDLCRGLSERLPGYECLLGTEAFANSRGADQLVDTLRY